jgi:hypothetical protein
MLIETTSFARESWSESSHFTSGLGIFKLFADLPRSARLDLSVPGQSGSLRRRGVDVDSVLAAFAMSAAPVPGKMLFEIAALHSSIVNV